MCDDIIPIFSMCSDHVFKIVLIGDPGVGKTSLLLRYVVRHHHANGIMIPFNLAKSIVLFFMHNKMLGNKWQLQSLLVIRLL